MMTMLAGWAITAAAGAQAPLAEAPDRAASAAPRCVIVLPEGARDDRLACLEQRLRGAAKRAQAEATTTRPAAPIDARSPDIRTGIANQAALRQRLGNQYGVGIRPLPTPPRIYPPTLP